MFRKLVVIVSAAAVLSCGDQGGGSGCDEATRKAALLADAQSWYLYQDLLPAVAPSTFGTADALLAALTAPARAAGKDRGWSYLVDRHAYEQYSQAGQSIGFGWSVAPVGDAANDVVHYVVVRQVFTGSAADRAGFVRGDRILAVGPTPGALTDVAGLTSAATGALFSTAGSTSKSFRVVPRGGQTAVVRSMTVAGYDVDPVPLHWVSGTTGYVQLRTFIAPAEAALRQAFLEFKDRGVTDVVVDLRYNAGGSLDTAIVLADLLGKELAHPLTHPMFAMQLNANHADYARVTSFGDEPDTVAFRRIAFLTTRSSASASELVPNVLDPTRTSTTIAYVGDRTYGKPVGQFVFDLAGCDTKLFLISFRLINAAGDQDYFDGLPDARSHAPLCAAADDFEHDQGAVDEGMTAAARYFVEHGECEPVTPALRLAGGARVLEVPTQPDDGPAARDMPGTY